MIAIKDMEMPTKCSSCLFNVYYENLGGYICEPVGKITEKDERWEKRLDDCPLVEIVTCKDCKHSETFVNFECDIARFCKKHRLQKVTDDYFCGDGKRRE